MRTHPALVAALVLACGGLAAPARAQADPPAQEEPRLELQPASLRLLESHRLEFIRTPDGAVWNVWGEGRFLEVFNDAVRKKEIKEKRQGGILTYWDTVGFEWAVDDSTDAAAWGVKEAWAGKEPAYWARPIDGEPPLRWTMHPSPAEFIYINETERDVYSEDLDLRCTRVVAEYGDTLFRVEVSGGRGMNPAEPPKPSRKVVGDIVLLPDRRLIKDGYLTGEFILWPDESIATPAGIEGKKFRYIPVEDLRMSVWDLERAVAGGEAEIVVWDYQRADGHQRWVRRSFPLRYRRPPSETEDRPIRPPPVSDVPITHLLVLKDGTYFEGQLLEETEESVRFLVVVAGIAGERTFSRSEIGRIVEKR